jgi:hypothetical protein
MNLKLLQEPHNFKVGDAVIVNDRFNNNTFEGTIYKIISLPSNKHIKPLDSIFIDYFYISFNDKAYDKILCRGLEIIYNHNPAILGNVRRNKNREIEEVFTQSSGPYSKETEISIRNVNAILIWREAFTILAKT